MTTNARPLQHADSGSLTASAPPVVTFRAWPYELVLAAVAGVAAYLLSCVLVAPTDAAIGFGEEWQKVSADPFAFPGALPQRFLAPLLAWICGFGGAPNWVPFTRGLAMLMLATIFFFCRRRGSSMVDAALITVSVAVVSPVQIFKQHWVGYSDALTYTLCFWMLLAARRPTLFWLLFFCNLMTHELAVFLLPWAWFVRRQQDARREGDVLRAIAALGWYVAFYFYVKSVAPNQIYSNTYFAQNPLFPGGTFVTWCLALAHWALAFGPVLAVVAWHQHRRPRDPDRGHFWWVLAGIVVIFCIAFDWSRHTNLMVVPMVLAAIAFLRDGHRSVFVGLVVAGIVLMLVWSPWPTGSWPTSELVEPEEHFLFKIGIVVPSGRPNEFGFGPLSAALYNWLPRVWPALVCMLAILAAIWAAGALFARRGRELQQTAAG